MSAPPANRPHSRVEIDARNAVVGQRLGLIVAGASPAVLGVPLRLGEFLVTRGTGISILAPILTFCCGVVLKQRVSHAISAAWKE
jgi:hypothetical protein